MECDDQPKNKDSEEKESKPEGKQDISKGEPTKHPEVSEVEDEDQTPAKDSKDPEKYGSGSDDQTDSDESVFSESSDDEIAKVRVLQDELQCKIDQMKVTYLLLRYIDYLEPSTNSFMHFRGRRERQKENEPEDGCAFWSLDFWQEAKPQWRGWRREVQKGLPV